MTQLGRPASWPASSRSTLAPSTSARGSSRKRYCVLPSLLLIPGLLLAYLILSEHALLSHAPARATKVSGDFSTLLRRLSDSGPRVGGACAPCVAPASALTPAPAAACPPAAPASAPSSAHVDAAPATPRVSAGRRGTLDDPDPIHLVYTLCGNPNEVEKDHYGLLGVKSVLMAKAYAPGAERHYVFHILTNVVEEELFNTTILNWEVYRAMEKERAAGLISYHVYSLQDLDDAARAVLGPANPNKAVPHHIFKNCAASRLKLPFLLGGKVDRVIYMDWDSIVTCDLTRLWGHFQLMRDEQVLGFARTDPSGVSDRDTYRTWKLPHHTVLGSINSGVMLMDIGKLHARERAGSLAFWASIAGILRSSTNLTGGPQDYWELHKAFPLGDQDVLNELFAGPPADFPFSRPEWLYIIPYEYNVCIDPPWLEDLRAVEHVPVDGYVGPPRPCIIHYCGNRLMSNTPGQEYLPVTDPIQGSFMFIKHFPLEKREPPPGMRPPPDGNDPQT